MTLISVEVATSSDEKITITGDSCTEHLAIVPIHGISVDRGPVFLGGWNLTHLPTGASVIPDLEQPGELPLYPNRVCDFSAVRPFAEWLERSYDLSISDPARLAELFTVEPGVQSIRDFYNSPETWSAPTNTADS